MKTQALTRRQALRGGVALPLAGCAHGPRGPATRRPLIVLRSAWQVENIGDIGHTPGALALFEKHVPEADVALWPQLVDEPVTAMLRKRFPRLEIVHGDLDENGRPTERALADLLARGSLFVHGSGSGMPGWRQVQAWRQAGNRPYGFLGVSLWDLGRSTRGLAAGARFVYCRDSKSVAYVRAQGLPTPVVDFGPDTTFGIDVADDARAEAYLAAEGLEPGRFICVVPRLRQTPYHQMRVVEWSDAEIDRRTAENEAHAEADHAKLREAIVAYVRKTGGKVVVCPEMTYQLGIAKPLVVDPLPDDVKPRVVLRRRYWLPNEAASLYARALAVLSLEMHSPILSVTRGTPAFYLRQPSDTVKGQMWRDIGLGAWMFELESDPGSAIASALLDVAGDPAAARGKVATAMALVRSRHEAAMATVRAALA